MEEMASGVQWGFAVCMQCLQDYFLCVFFINVSNYKSKPVLNFKEGTLDTSRNFPSGSAASCLTSLGPPGPVSSSAM